MELWSWQSVVLMVIVIALIQLYFTRRKEVQQ